MSPNATDTGFVDRPKSRQHMASDAGSQECPVVSERARATCLPVSHDGVRSGLDIKQDPMYYAAHSELTRLRKSILELANNKVQAGRRPVGDYKQIYLGDECGDDMDETAPFDASMIKGWRNTINTQIVYAGLLSAMLTTCVVHTSQSLQPNLNQINTSLLQELASIQRAILDGKSLDDVPPSLLGPDSSASPTTADILVNGLWFISLILSLSSAMFAVLVKQWLHHYVTVQFGTARDRHRMRQLRHTGLEQRHVPAIIGLLHSVLYISLMMFLAGFVISLAPLQRAAEFVVGAIRTARLIF